MNKTYIGDAVYVELDESNQIKLTTGDGQNMVIYMEGTVLIQFLIWLRDSGYVNNKKVMELFNTPQQEPQHD